MSAHIVVPGLDDGPATLSSLLVDLLRTELDFRGMVLSDGMEMRGITGSMSLADGCVRAIAAGVDLLCIGGDHAGEDTVLEVADALVAAVHDGRLDEARLVDAPSTWPGPPTNEPDSARGAVASPRTAAATRRAVTTPPGSRRHAERSSCTARCARSGPSSRPASSSSAPRPTSRSVTRP